eukprot:TRINITY_DN8671_c0_g4_i1.p1 TRINITY_DN8671_c0_g4~~TRINITY_DN8671_c0_g4_i1.p1  ORF type:complete len:466 (+),score=117.85 TRINITY_DN8671_c0_g4_i1:540-1937(+)
MYQIRIPERLVGSTFVEACLRLHHCIVLGYYEGSHNALPVLAPIRERQEYMLRSGDYLLVMSPDLESATVVYPAATQPADLFRSSQAHLQLSQIRNRKKTLLKNLRLLMVGYSTETPDLIQTMDEIVGEGTTLSLVTQRKPERLERLARVAGTLRNIRLVGPDSLAENSGSAEMEQARARIRELESELEACRSAAVTQEEQPEAEAGVAEASTDGPGYFNCLVTGDNLEELPLGPDEAGAVMVLADDLEEGEEGNVADSECVTISFVLRQELRRRGSHAAVICELLDPASTSLVACRCETIETIEQTRQADVLFFESNIIETGLVAMSALRPQAFAVLEGIAGCSCHASLNKAQLNMPTFRELLPFMSAGEYSFWELSYQVQNSWFNDRLAGAVLVGYKRLADRSVDALTPVYETRVLNPDAALKSERMYWLADDLLIVMKTRDVAFSLQLTKTETTVSSFRPLS